MHDDDSWWWFMMMMMMTMMMMHDDNSSWFIMIHHHSWCFMVFHDDISPSSPSHPAPGGRHGSVGQSLSRGAKSAQLLPPGNGHGLPTGRHTAGGHGSGIPGTQGGTQGSPRWGMIHQGNHEKCLVFMGCECCEMPGVYSLWRSGWILNSAYVRYDMYALSESENVAQKQQDSKGLS